MLATIEMHKTTKEILNRFNASRVETEKRYLELIDSPSGFELLIPILQLIKKINAGAFNVLLKTSKDSLKIKMTKYIEQCFSEFPQLQENENSQTAISEQVNSMLNPWTLFFLQYDPYNTLKKVKCPVLALNGEKDLQIPPKQNLDAIKKGLENGNNKKFTIKELPNLNHLFQECKTGSPKEYREIEQTISPLALDEILNWIKNR